MTNLVCDFQFKRLKQYCKRLGWSVVCKHSVECSADFESRIIVINSQLKPEIRLYRLLHEIGHILISHRKNYKQKFGCYAASPKDLQKNINKLCVVEEEFVAWDRGLQLARKQNISINEARFNKDKTQCLMSWVKWAAGNKTK